MVTRQKLDAMERRIEQNADDAHKKTGMRIRSIELRHTDLANKVNAGFARMEKRFDNVDKRLDDVDKRLDDIDKRLDGVDKRLDGVAKRFDGVDERFDDIEGKLDMLLSR